MKQLFTIFLLFLFTTAIAQHHGSQNPDKPSVHGMLIFGKENIYASHLPLFHTPHDYQIILQLKLSLAAQQKFLKDQQLHPEFTAYTIEPERFVLPDMIGKPKPFKANLYRGHFERGGVKILDSITIQIVQVIYFKKFNPEENKLTAAQYIFFGSGKEQFAAHLISNKPDFEQIIQVKAAPGLFVRNEKYALLTFNDAANEPTVVSGNTIEVMDFEKKAKLMLLKQVYLEFDDLKE